ncbi:MAG TPA: hypothetical protein VFN57_01220 [Thermomicrobiaceae bacterium]|nr:hypothetical protein [Thermomicrobiaceae bacterium]
MAEKQRGGTTTHPTPEEDRRFLEEHADQLSPATKHARWVHAPDEGEEHPGQTLATRSHDVIQHWAQQRNATPATVPGTERGGRPSVMRFDFPGHGGKDLQHISWEDWFRTFDERQLVFLFQQHMRDGRESNFFMMDSPSREHD